MRDEKADSAATASLSERPLKAGTKRRRSASTSSGPEPDCFAPLVWNGETCSAVTDVEQSRLGRRLGTGVLPGCGPPGSPTPKNGVPFVRFGDELTLVVRVCDSKQSAPGAAGLRLLVAARLGR